MPPVNNFAPCGDCFLHLIVHASQDLFRRKWTELSLRIHWVANLERAHALNELLKKPLINFVRDNESLRCDTGLTGVDRARFDRSAQRRFEVCAWHHDECIAAAQLEHTFFDFTRGRARDSRSGFFAACHRYGFDARIDD